MSATPHIRLGGVRIDIRAGGHIRDFADLLMALTRGNLRALIDDPIVRQEAIRRVQSPPCPVRCYVSSDGTRHDCHCASGFQYTSDGEAQALEGCPPRDVWNDLRSLFMAHHAQGRGPDEPILIDCDCITPASLAVAAYLAWYAPRTQLAGINLGAFRDDAKRFAIGITLPPPPKDPTKERVGHVYGLLSYMPPAPQPAVQLRAKDGSVWWVWDGAAHFGMERPPDSFYSTGEVVAYELRRDDLYGLSF